MTLLLTWAWQGLVLALAVHLALRALRCLDAATRHAIWWGALGAVILLPVLLAASWAWSGGAAASPGLSTPGAPAASGYLLTVPAPPAAAAQAAVGIWLACTAVRVGRLVHGWRAIDRIVRDSAPLDAAIEGRLVCAARARRTGPPVTLRLSEAVRVPCAVGLGRAVVLLPPSLARALDADDLDRIVLHEYAHLLRRDDLWRLAQALLEAPLGLHPAVAWIGRQIELEREAACDDVVVALVGERERYAGALLKTAWHARRARPRPPGAPPLAPAATRAGRLLRARVERLLDAGRPRRLRPAASSCAAGCALLTAVALALVSVPPPIGASAQEAEAATVSASPARLPAPPSPGVPRQVPAGSMSPDRRQAPDQSARERPGAASLTSSPLDAPRAARRPVPGSGAGRSAAAAAAPAKPAESAVKLQAIAAPTSTTPPADEAPSRGRARGAAATLDAAISRDGRLAMREPGAAQEPLDPLQGAWPPALSDARSAALAAARRTPPAGLSARPGPDLEPAAARPPAPGEAGAVRLEASNFGGAGRTAPVGAEPPPVTGARARRPGWTALVDAGRAVDRGFTRGGSTLARRFVQLGEAVARTF